MSMFAAFIHPGLLWGLGLVSVPIIIHLITRRRYKTIDWAAMEFLLEAERKSRRRIRIENLILLATRMLLIGLIPLALARPMASSLGLGWLAGAFRSEEHIIAIDDSLSMAHVEAGSSSLDRARAAAAATLERVAGRSARGAVTIVRSSRPDEPLRRGAYVDQEHLPILLREIEGIAPTHTRLAPDRLAASLADLAGSDPRAGRTVVIASDFRRIDWEGARDAARDAFERLTGAEGNAVRLVFLDIGPRDRENLAVTQVALSRRVPVAGVPIDIAVTVANTGAAAAHGVRTNLRVGDAEIPGPTIDEIPAGDARTVRIAHTFNEPGTVFVEGRIDGDRLAADDARVAAIEVADAVRVLLVDGEPSLEPFASETDFLAVALDPLGEVSSGLKTERMTEDRLAAVDLAAYDMVVLANLYSVASREAERLIAYVRSGGGLAIFLGDQVDADLANQSLGAILPAAIGEPVSRPAAGEAFHLVPSLEHPALRQLRGDSAALLARVGVETFARLAPAPDARILMRFTDPDRSPAVVERTIDAGRVVIVATSADREWTDWPRHPSYLVFLQDLVPYLGRARGAGRNVMAGTPVAWPLDIATCLPKARLRTPLYPDDPEKEIHAEPEGSEFRLRILDTRIGGRYALVLSPRSGGSRIERIAVASDPRESDLEPATEERLREILADVPFVYIRDTAGLGARDGGAWELSGLLMGIFIALALFELLLAWRIRKRGGS
ncbi:MAG: BatA domain-containing protein [Planctomycetes bacterium]|nr:BatA domain-containing protein [Planctomycetota bacterium]